MPRAPATIRAAADPLAFLHPAARAWFTACFDAPTPAQALGWPPIAGGASALLLAPTGSGKTLAAFLSAINRLMFAPPPPSASASTSTRSSSASAAATPPSASASR